MKKGRPQCKDLDDRKVLETVQRLSLDDEGGARRKFSDPPYWVMIWDLQRELGDLPNKLLRAKCQALIDRKLLDGCTCGCRGDLELTSKGTEFLTKSESLGNGRS